MVVGNSLKNLQKLVTRDTDFGAIWMKQKEKIIMPREKEHRIELLLPNNRGSVQWTPREESVGFGGKVG